MIRTICDRCNQPIVGRLSIVGLWSEEGSICNNGLPKMNHIPAVAIQNLCPVCRKEIEKAIKGEQA